MSESNADYNGKGKDECRSLVFTNAVETLVKLGLTPSSLKVLILVSGKTPQNLDVLKLEELGVARNNIWAISRCWEQSVRDGFYSGVNTFNGELHRFLQTNNGRTEFNIVYFDFCKPLLSEINEKQATCLFNLYAFNNLAQQSVLIQTHNIENYLRIKDAGYRDFVLRYGTPDYQQNGNSGSMSVRAMVSGPMFMGQDLFLQEGYFNQKVQVLMCFIDGFIRDVAEVYVPHSKCRAVDENLIEMMEQLAPGNIDPNLLREDERELFKMKNMLHGRMGQCIRLLNDIPANYREQLAHITGSMNEMRTAAALAEWCDSEIILERVYRPRSIGSNPYRGGVVSGAHMLTLAWEINRMDNVPAKSLWGALDSRR